MCDISVIIPCYNVERYLLLRCIDSVLRQDFTNYEVILVDDGSKMEYKASLQLVQCRDSRIHLFEQDNKGVSAARNYGMSVSKGKYIVFADADDMLVPSFFKEAYEIAEKTDADFVIGGNIRLEEEESTSINNTPLYYACYDEEDCKFLKPYMVGELLKSRFENVYFGRGPWTRLVKREFALINPFDTKLSIGEDIVWNLQLLNQCERVCLTHRAWYRYFYNIDSASKRFNDQVVNIAITELKAIRKELDLVIDKEYSAYCVRIMDELKRIYHCYLGRKECPLSFKEQWILKRQLYRDAPWKEAANKRFYKNASFKYKLLCLLYRWKCLFLFFKFMSLLRK